MNDIRNVAVVGAGTMGNGIAQVFAQHGFNVTMIDTDASPLERAIEAITHSLGKFVDKERLSSDDRDATLARIETATSLEYGLQTRTWNRSRSCDPYSRVTVARSRRVTRPPSTTVPRRL